MSFILSRFNVLIEHEWCLSWFKNRCFHLQMVREWRYVRKKTEHVISERMETTMGSENISSRLKTLQKIQENKSYLLHVLESEQNIQPSCRLQETDPSSLPFSPTFTRALLPSSLKWSMSNFKCLISAWNPSFNSSNCRSFWNQVL